MEFADNYQNSRSSAFIEKSDSEADECSSDRQTFGYIHKCWTQIFVKVYQML